MFGIQLTSTKYTCGVPYQQELNFRGSEVSRVNLDEHVLWVVLGMTVFLYALTHPCNFHPDVLERLLKQAHTLN